MASDQTGWRAFSKRVLREQPARSTFPQNAEALKTASSEWHGIPGLQLRGDRDRFDIEISWGWVIAGTLGLAWALTRELGQRTPATSLAVGARR